MIGHENMIGRLSIPYITPTGVVEIRFAAVNRDENTPKYLSTAGAEDKLYNVVAFQEDSDVIAICEGEVDTITAHYLCGIPAIGLSGSQKWKDWYARAFNGEYRRVFVLADGDSPGRELGKRIAQQIDVAVVVSMPDSQDVNSIYLSEGADGIRRRVGL